MASHDQLAADLDGIESWGSALDNVREGLDTPVTLTGDDQIGSDPASTTVQSALSDFDSSLTTARSIIDSYMVALSRMCKDTAAKIREMDHSLARPLHHRPDI